MRNCRLGRSVSIIGTGYTPMGHVAVSEEILNFTERELFSQACLEAMEDGGIEAKDIDAFYVGMAGPNYFSKLTSASSHFADWIGMRGKPGVFHDEGCGTVGVGLHEAVLAVASGAYDCAISAAVNISSTQPRPAYPPHMREPLDNDTLWAAIYTSNDPAYDQPGTAGAGNMEIHMMQYLKKYGYHFDDYKDAMVKYLQIQRKQALTNPKAVMTKKTYEQEAAELGEDNVDEFLSDDIFNPSMGSFIRSRFMGMTVDGASAVIVCATEHAHKYTKHPIEIAGISTCSYVTRDWMNYPMQCEVDMYEEAYAMAGIKDPSKEIDYLAIHDCSGVPIFAQAELSGYMQPGECMKYMLAGETGFDGKKPLTTSGGRTQLGHPLAPAFAIEVDEAVRQMRGTNGPRQMKNPPKTSVIYGGGAGYSSVLAVLKSK